MRLQGDRGQNIIEYLLVVVAVVVVVLALTNTRNGPMKNALENIFDTTVNGVSRLNSELKFSN
jgi:hypothetical protein